MQKPSKFFWEYLYLFLVIVESITALFFFFQNPSDPETALFLGFSPLRLIVGVIFLTLLVISVWLLVKGLRKPVWFNNFVVRLRTWFSGESRKFITISILLYLFFMLLGFLLLLYSPNFQDYKSYSQIFANSLGYYEIIRTLVDRLLPLFIFAVVIVFQSAVWLFFGFQPEEKEKNKGLLSKAILVLVLLTVSVFHWFILAMQLRVFKNIPGWYWDVSAKPFGARDLIFILLFALAVVVVRAVLKNPDKVKRNLLFIFLLGWSLQVGFGFIEGEGFESLRFKYIDSSHRTHASQAVKSTLGLAETVRNYEALYSDDSYQRTKPPGTLLVYIALKNAANAFFPRDTLEGEFVVLTTVEAYLFPLVSFVVVFFIYRIAQKINPGEGSILPSIFYVLMPNVILIPLFLDQVLYPLLFTLGVLITIYAVDKGGFGWALLNGAALYIIAFFSFSMLPLIPFAFIYIGIGFVVQGKERDFWKSVRIGLGIVLGLVLMFALFYFALDYNVFVRYQSAMEMVRNFDFLQRVHAPSDEVIENTGFLLKPGQILSAFILNNTEFASVVGFPFYLLFVIQGLRAIVAVIKKQSSKGDIVLLTYFGTFVLMNIFAPIQGEAARLWLFWAPMIAIFAGTLIPKIFTRYNRWVLFLAAMQLITIYLTYKFQDLAP